MQGAPWAGFLQECLQSLDPRGAGPGRRRRCPGGWPRGTRLGCRGQEGTLVLPAALWTLPFVRVTFAKMTFNLQSKSPCISCCPEDRGRLGPPPGGPEGGDLAGMALLPAP